MVIRGVTTSTQETSSTIHRQAFVITSIVSQALWSQMILAMDTLSSATIVCLASQVEKEAHARIMAEYGAHCIHTNKELERWQECDSFDTGDQV